VRLPIGATSREVSRKWYWPMFLRGKYLGKLALTEEYGAPC
jgi:hypothetical protein